MQKLVRIFSLVFLSIGSAYAYTITDISIDFCGTSANTLNYNLLAGVETGICYTLTNNSPAAVQVKVGFVDGTFTNDEQKNKACLNDGDVKNFGKYVTGYNQFVSLQAGETVKNEAKILYATDMNGLYHGCIVYSIVDEPKQNSSGFSIIVRSARFIDVQVGSPKTIQSSGSIVEKFTPADSENIFQEETKIGIKNIGMMNSIKYLIVTVIIVLMGSIFFVMQEKKKKKKRDN